MNCPKCQTASIMEANFCSNCGCKLKLSTPQKNNFGMPSDITMVPDDIIVNTFHGIDTEKSPGVKARPRILIIDDSRSARVLCKQLLKPMNAKIETATNGREGLDKAMASPFDLIITDYDMPKMNGIELCRAVKSSPNTRNIPVIMVSTFDSDEDIETGFQSGVNIYLSKKDVRSQLLNTTKQTLWKSSVLHHQKILVVDNSQSILTLLEEGLSNAGFLVTTAQNGRIALDFLSYDTPDLILSDINMPEINGFEFCKAVKRNPRLSLIPFIVMSSNKDRGHMNRMIQHGAAAYIVKPFNLDQLVISIEKILSLNYLMLLKERKRLDTERTFLLDSITSLISALEARDAYTRGHSESVSRITVEMATLAGINDEDLQAITIGCRLHDIGKIGIRDSVLLKPGKLTDDEYDHIKQHPVIGESILQSIPSLSNILPIVSNHHERWDGNGYPMGLKGENISFWARMTAVADTFDALVSDRPYRKGMPIEKALQIIREVKESQLCPESVDIFFKWIDLNQESEQAYHNNYISPL